MSSDIARRIEPRARTKPVFRQQQWFLSELDNIEHTPATKSVLLRKYGPNVDGIEQPPVEALIVARRHDRQVNITSLELTIAGDPDFQQFHLNAGMTAQIVHEEGYDKVFDHLRSSADTQLSNLSAFERARPLAKRIGVRRARDCA